MQVDMDAVITWVDGSDPIHQEKRNAAMKDAGYSSTTPSNATYETRFADNGEVYFNIASILKFAPFIRKIFIVTAEQTPHHLHTFAREGICSPDMLCIVPHSEIFRNYEGFLPTFNSLSIETMLWRIKGLSEDFLYLNDDFFFNGPVTENYFFDEQHRLKVCGRERSIKPLLAKLAMRRWRYWLLRKGVLPAHYKTAQAMSAALAGRKTYVQIEHHPHALNKSAFADFFEKNPLLLRQQLSHKFRSAKQFLPVGLCNHLELEAGRAVQCKTRDVLYLKPTNYSSQQLEELASTNKTVGCIQSLDEFPASAVADIWSTLGRKLEGYLPRAILNQYLQRALTM